MTAVLLALAIGFAGTSAAFLGLYLASDQALTRSRAQVATVTKERDDALADAHLHETWTIGGGEAWAA